MSAGEIVFRICASLGVWMLLISHALVVATLPSSACPTADPQTWVGTGILAGVCGVGLLLLGVGLRWRQTLRWVAAAALLLVALALRGVLPMLLATTLGGAPLCGETGVSPTSFERVWPALQTLVLLGGAVQALRYWRPVPAES